LRDADIAYLIQRDPRALHVERLVRHGYCLALQHPPGHHKEAEGEGEQKDANAAKDQYDQKVGDGSGYGDEEDSQDERPLGGLPRLRVSPSPVEHVFAGGYLKLHAALYACALKACGLRNSGETPGRDVGEGEGLAFPVGGALSAFSGSRLRSLRWAPHTSSRR